MLKKRMKAICLACMLVCNIPMVSSAIDKDEFLKFLIDSSYPETKTEENKETSENSKEESKENDDYIKVHIGEENVPIINNSSIDSEEGNKNSNTEVSNITSGYVNNIKVTSDKPRILLYHTHSCETYLENSDGNYHSEDLSTSVRVVGQHLTNELEKLGMGVVHTTKLHDNISYNSSYSNSLKTLNELLPKYPSVDISIDLHREGKDWTSDAGKKQLEETYSATINGEKVAKFFFVVGGKNQNADEVNKLANDLTKIAKEKYPQLILPVIKKDYAKFNQYVADNGILVEIGSNATSVEEAKAATKYVADVINTYFSQN